MSSKGIHWRAMTTLDLPTVEEIAAVVHPDFFEEQQVFAERQRLYPDGARFLELDGEPAGYVFSHPWAFRHLPDLNSLLVAIPPDAATYYIHDLALLPQARGTGAAAMVVAALIGHAFQSGYATMSLVAVNSSQWFWEKHGFEVVEVPELAGKLTGYEDAARFMVRSQEKKSG
jgi:GNAT superfamily N-acetyltransferase